MIDGALRDKTNDGGGDPLPERDVFVHLVRFDFCLGIHVEDLQLPLRYRPGGTSAQSDGTGPATRLSPLSAMILSLRCMIAESAAIGLRMTLLASARSTMTT